MSCYGKQSLMIFLIDLSRDFQSIREISFIISLYLILLISVVNFAKFFAQNFLGTKLSHNRRELFQPLVLTRVVNW